MTILIVDHGPPSQLKNETPLIVTEHNNERIEIVERDGGKVKSKDGTVDKKVVEIVITECCNTERGSGENGTTVLETQNEEINIDADRESGERSKVAIANKNEMRMEIVKSDFCGYKSSSKRTTSAKMSPLKKASAFITKNMTSSNTLLSGMMKRPKRRSRSATTTENNDEISSDEFSSSGGASSPSCSNVTPLSPLSPVPNGIQSSRNVHLPLSRSTPRTRVRTITAKDKRCKSETPTKKRDKLSRLDSCDGVNGDGKCLTCMRALLSCGASAISHFFVQSGQVILSTSSRYSRGAVSDQTRHNIRIVFDALRANPKITVARLDGLLGCVGRFENILLVENEEGYNLLQKCVGINHVGLVKWILNHRRNSYDINRGVCSLPLHIACLKGHVEIVELLLKHGARMDVEARMCWPAPHHPTCTDQTHNNHSKRYYCYQRTSRSKEKSAIGSNGHTSVSKQSSYQSVTSTSGGGAVIGASYHTGRSIRTGMDILYRSCDKLQSALFYAIDGDQAEVLSVLLEEGEDHWFVPIQLPLPCQTQKRLPLLHVTCERGAFKCLKFLVSERPDEINMCSDGDEYFPIHQAALQHDIKFMNLLIQSGACTTVQTSTQQMNALQVVLLQGKKCADSTLSTMKLLLESSKSSTLSMVNEADSLGNTPLHVLIIRYALEERRCCFNNLHHSNDMINPQSSANPTPSNTSNPTNGSSSSHHPTSGNHGSNSNGLYSSHVFGPSNGVAAMFDFNRLGGPNDIHHPSRRIRDESGGCGEDGSCSPWSKWDMLHIMRYLLQMGAKASINLPRNSALASILRHISDWDFRYDLLQMLLEASGDPNVEGRDGSVPLMVCLVPLINKDPLNHFTHAMKMRYLNCVRILLKYGANPNCSTRSNLTPLHVLVFTSSENMSLTRHDDKVEGFEFINDLLTLLLQHGLNPNIVFSQRFYHILFAIVAMVQTARQPSDLDHIYDLIRTLLLYGADPNVVLDVSGNSSNGGMGYGSNGMQSHGYCIAAPSSGGPNSNGHQRLLLVRTNSSNRSAASGSASSGPNGSGNGHQSSTSSGAVNSEIGCGDILQQRFIHNLSSTTNVQCALYFYVQRLLTKEHLCRKKGRRASRTTVDSASRTPTSSPFNCGSSGGGGEDFGNSSSSSRQFSTSNGVRNRRPSPLNSCSSSGGYSTSSSGGLSTSSSGYHSQHRGSYNNPNVYTSGGNRKNNQVQQMRKSSCLPSFLRLIHLFYSVMRHDILFASLRVLHAQTSCVALSSSSFSSSTTTSSSLSNEESCGGSTIDLMEEEPPFVALAAAIRELHSKPRSLKQIARVAIYNALGYAPAPAINKLAIPTQLKEYLLSFQL